MSDVLRGKVAIVTGAGRGIGRGIAMCLAREGAKVLVNDPGSAMDGSGNDQSLAVQVVDEITKSGGTATPNFDSVATMDGGQSIVKTALERYGTLDIVVACAGNARNRMIYEMTEEEWDDVIRVHLKGTFTVVKHACVHFRQQRSGRIITITSEGGLGAAIDHANYGAAKSGIAGLTKVLARDMGKYGVTANSIAPRGWSRIWAAVRDDADEARAKIGLENPVESKPFDPNEFNPDDIGPFVAYLASDYAAKVNGNVFKVYAGTVELMSHPRHIRSIYKEGRWTLEELFEVCPDQLTAGLINPSPPQPVKT